MLSKGILEERFKKGKKRGIFLFGFIDIN